MQRSNPLTAVRSATQSRRKRSGDAAERLVEAMNLACAHAGVAWLHKVPTPTVGPNGAMRYRARASVDYVGHMADGRAVYVEVKRVASGRLQLARIEPHQRNVLDRAVASGCVAMLLVVHGPRCDVYTVPWEAVGALLGISLTRGLGSLTVADMEYWRVDARRPWLERFSRNVEIEAAYEAWVRGIQSPRSLPTSLPPSTETGVLERPAVGAAFERDTRSRTRGSYESR